MSILVFIFLFCGSISFFIYSITRSIKFLKIGTKKDDRTGNTAKRLKNVIVIAFGQSKLLKDKPAGILHFFIFWGFILFLFAVIEAVLQGFYKEFSLNFLGYLYSVITVIEDVLGVLVVFSVLFALFRRFVQRVPRLKVDKEGRKDALLILLLILVVVLCMFGQNISHLAKAGYKLSSFEVRPVSLLLSRLFFNSVSGNAEIFYEVFWWVHIITVFGFMNYLPYSKHFHVITSIPNTYLANLEPERNTIKKLDLEDESSEVFGANDVGQLSWKQLLDGYTCTECGRCTDACPAANAGKALSPRKIIVDIRHRLAEVAPVILNKNDNALAIDNSLLHNYISDKELWQCTTCMACVQECPVMIEHIDSIVDMRRYLVLTESVFPGELNNVFKNLETNFTPWAFNHADRVNWAEGLNIKTMAEDSHCDLLFWVGCAGSFDNRYKKVSVAFSKLMQKAGVDFRILGNEEKCNGDTARRLGNEYLAQMLIKENIETLNGYGVKKIVTACPHCFNSLKNEYKQFGGNFEVLHHTQLLESLLSAGKLIINDKNTSITTYHDSCYIGRYNNEYNAPRNILSKTAKNVIEPVRKKSNGFCCGAGGGRMFLEDAEGKRINELRTEELLNTGAEVISSACPFCMTMLTDGVKHFEKSDSVAVKDITEILLEQTK
ncbi:MAG: (Fe-S)-binding protein [Bacteroidota bacterium]|nr:(Fe-S)-binding protein [Bacteroidota bacterium]